MFSLENSQNGGRQLVLRQTPILMDMDEDEQQHPIVLAKDVKEFSFEFWDLRKGDWVDEWTQTNQLPKLVRFTLRFGSSDPGQVTRRSRSHAYGVAAIDHGPGESTSAGPARHDATLGFCMRLPSHPDNRGIALIVVMIAITVLSLLAAAFAYSMKVEMTLARNADTDSEFLWLGRSGVEKARWVLAQQLTVGCEPVRRAESNLGWRIGEHVRVQQPVVGHLNDGLRGG